jgi:hypothetical protein
MGAGGGQAGKIFFLLRPRHSINPPPFRRSRLIQSVAVLPPSHSRSQAASLGQVQVQTRIGHCERRATRNRPSNPSVLRSSSSAILVVVAAAVVFVVVVFVAVIVSVMGSGFWLGTGPERSAEFVSSCGTGSFPYGIMSLRRRTAARSTKDGRWAERRALN